MFRRWLVLAVAVVASTWTLVAQEPAPAAARLRTGDELMVERRYPEALVEYRGARESDDETVRVRAGAGAVRSLLRLARFAQAARESAGVAARDPGNADAVAVNGDGLWAAGMFFEAEREYDAALAMDPRCARALNGRARSLAAQFQFEPALDLASRATANEPNEPLYQHTLASVLEQLRRYEEAVSALERYLAQIPREEDEDLRLAARSRIRMLSGFAGRRPYEIVNPRPVYTVPLTVANGLVKVRGRLNGRTAIDFILDTGADATVLTPNVARRAGVSKFTSLRAAGVGDVGVGFRDLQIALLDRLDIGDLRIENVSTLIKDPALRGLPAPEGALFSPLALGLSMRVDYEHRVLTMASLLPAQSYDTRLPLRMDRLPMVRGTVNGTTAANFVLDTGGQATTLGRNLAATLNVDPEARRVPVRVYGSSGWDRTAYLLPFVDVELASGVGQERTSVVVLNLDAPSRLLGFEIGGILGHQFLSRYHLTIDLPRHEVGLTSRTARITQE